MKKFFFSFLFPFSFQANVTNNGHHSPLNHRTQGVASANNPNSQPSTPTHNPHLLTVQLQDQTKPSGQPWSNPVLSPLMVKRINENNVVAPMSMDDDEDPSASIDALVGKFQYGRTVFFLFLFFSSHFQLMSIQVRMIYSTIKQQNLLMRLNRPQHLL